MGGQGVREAGACTREVWSRVMELLPKAGLMEGAPWILGAVRGTPWL